MTMNMEHTIKENMKCSFSSTCMMKILVDWSKPPIFFEVDVNGYIADDVNILSTLIGVIIAFDFFASDTMVGAIYLKIV